MSKHPAAVAADSVLNNTKGAVASIVILLMDDGSLDICLAGAKSDAEVLLPVLRDLEGSAVKHARGGVMPTRVATIGGVPIDADAFIDGKFPDGKGN